MQANNNNNHDDVNQEDDSSSSTSSDDDIINYELPPFLRHNPQPVDAPAVPAAAAAAAAEDAPANNIADNNVAAANLEDDAIFINSSSSDDEDAEVNAAVAAVQDIVVLDYSSDDNEVDAAVAGAQDEAIIVNSSTDDDEVEVVAIDAAVEDVPVPAIPPIDFDDFHLVADPPAIPADVAPPVEPAAQPHQQPAVGRFAGIVRRMSMRSPQEGQRSNSAAHHQHNRRQRTPVQRMIGGISNIIRGRTPPNNPPTPPSSFPDPFEPPPLANGIIPGLWSNNPAQWSSTSALWVDANQPFIQQDLVVQNAATLQPDVIATTITNHPAYGTLQGILDDLNENEPPNNQRHLLPPDGWVSDASHVVNVFGLSFRPNTRHVAGQRHLNATADGDIVEESLNHIVDAAVDVMCGAFSDMVDSPEVARSLLLATSFWTNRMFVDGKPTWYSNSTTRRSFRTLAQVTDPPSQELNQHLVRTCQYLRNVILFGRPTYDTTSDMSWFTPGGNDARTFPRQPFMLWHPCTITMGWMTPEARENWLIAMLLLSANLLGVPARHVTRGENGQYTLQEQEWMNGIIPRGRRGGGNNRSRGGNNRSRGGNNQSRERTVLPSIFLPGALVFDANGNSVPLNETLYAAWQEFVESTLTSDERTGMGNTINAATRLRQLHLLGEYRCSKCNWLHKFRCLGVHCRRGEIRTDTYTSAGCTGKCQMVTCPETGNMFPFFAYLEFGGCPNEGEKCLGKANGKATCQCGGTVNKGKFNQGYNQYQRQRPPFKLLLHCFKDGKMVYPSLEGTGAAITHLLPKLQRKLQEQGSHAWFESQGLGGMLQLHRQRLRRSQDLANVLGHKFKNDPFRALVIGDREYKMVTWRLEQVLSSNHVLANGTRLSAKMTRRYEWESSKAGNLSFGFSSNRVLTMYQGRTVHATFSFGVGSNLKMQYGILSLVTWGFRPTSPEDDANEKDMDDSENNEDGDENSRQNSRDTNETKLLPPPQLSAKFALGSQFPLEFGIAQNDLFHSPYRSGDATISWGFTGYRIKGMINREIPNYNTSELYNSQFLSSVGIGIEHTPLSGLKWLLRYERPEGVTIHIPIFVSRFLAPNYFNDVIWWSALSFLMDETIGELCQQTQLSTDSTITSRRETITDKITANRNEQQWLTSSKASSNAEKQLNIMRPVAACKRKREAARNGLVIIKATYYRQILSPDTSYDVTEQLQFFVQNSRLVLPASSKSCLLGFSQLERDTPQPEQNHSYASIGKKILASLLAKRSYEICEDSAVRLTVRYRFKGNVFETTIGDDDSLQLPNEEDLNLGESYLVT